MVFSHYSYVPSHNPKKKIFPILRLLQGYGGCPKQGLYLRNGSEFQKSPRWRHLYSHKLQTAAPYAPVASVVRAVRGGARVFGGSSSFKSITTVKLQEKYARERFCSPNSVRLVNTFDFRSNEITSNEFCSLKNILPFPVIFFL